MRLPESEAVTEIMRAVARETIMPRFRDLAHGEVREKGPGDLVTVVDEESEARLTAALLDLLPGSLVVGEEAAAVDPTLLGRIAGDRPVWIVDPLDGTANFAGGIERFAMIVALAVGGRTVAGWIHDPNTGRTGHAAAGEGGAIDGTPLKVAAPGPLEAMTGFVSGPKYSGAYWPRLKALRGRLASGHNLRCAGIEYLELASGQAHISIPVRLMPWDHAAGVLLYREAGGHAAMLDGTDYAPTRHEGMLILAPDRATWQRLKDWVTAPDSD